MTKVLMSLEVPEDHSYIRLIRSLGRSILEHESATAADVDDIEALVGELCANVTRHARSERGRFVITLEHENDRVVVTVEDHGPGFSVGDVPDVGSTRADGGEDDRIGGYGLQMVSMLADHVEFQSKDTQGTVARVEKKLRPEVPT